MKHSIALYLILFSTFPAYAQDVDRMWTEPSCLMKSP